MSLAVRLGINTGLVVVGEIGGGGRREQLALGETPNVAARLQGIAEPGTVMVSEATYRLLRGTFACGELGPQVVKGLPEPVRARQVAASVGKRALTSRRSRLGSRPWSAVSKK